MHDTEDTSPAPGDLELVRSFLSLHDHEPGNPDSLSPGLGSIRWWFTSAGLIGEAQAVPEEDLAWANEVRSALISKVREHMGAARDPDAIALLNGAAEATGLRLCFGCPDDAPIHVEESGVRGAVGRILGTAFLAELDGRWDRFRICNNPGCSEVFYDRSRNRTGKWCSMSACGNRAKVRAFRERQAAG